MSVDREDAAGCGRWRCDSLALSCPPSCRAAAEIKKQRDFYQKLGMEVPGDIKGELNNMKTHLDQRNGTFRRLLLGSAQGPRSQRALTPP